MKTYKFSPSLFIMMITPFSTDWNLLSIGLQFKITISTILLSALIFILAIIVIFIVWLSLRHQSDMKKDKIMKEQAKLSIEEMVKNNDISGLDNSLISENWYLREAAADAYEQIGIPNNPTINARYLVAKREFDLISPHGEVALEPLILALKHPDTFVRSNAASALADIGNSDAVQPLINAVVGLDPRAIINIATPLGEFNNSFAIDRLIDALHSSNASIRWVAVYALGEIGDNRAVTKLEQLALSDKGKTYDNGTVKNAAKIALQKIYWRDRSLEQLINALRDPNELVRFGAADALGRRGDSSSIDALINSLDDSKLNVREAVIKALGKIGDFQAVDPLTNIILNDTSLRWQALNVVEEIAGTPVEILMKLLKNPEQATRLWAAIRLRKANDMRAVNALENLLNEDQGPAPLSESIKKSARESIEEIQGRIEDNN